MCVSIEGGRILFTFFQVRLLLEFSKFQVAWSTLQSDFILTVSYRNSFGLWAVPVLIIFYLLPTLIYSPPFSVLLFLLLFCFAWRGWPYVLPHQPLSLADFQLGPANDKHCQDTGEQEGKEKLGVFCPTLFLLWCCHSGNGFSFISTATTGCSQPPWLQLSYHWALAGITSSHCCPQYPLLVPYSYTQTFIYIKASLVEPF